MRHGFMIAALAGTALGAPAAGQTNTAAVTDVTPDIIVTAERRETRLQDTPISITVLSAGQIEAKGIRSINDLAAQVPNLTSTTGPQGSADANFFVRGVGQFDFIITNDPGVGVYVDGVFLGRSIGAMLETADIARVEVLRGPQGTLFGRNTLGGAISITSVQPALGDLTVNGRATYGSRNRIDVDGAVNFALGDKAAIRVSGVTRNQDGFATNALTGEKFGKTKRDGARAALLY
ncbi:MAG: TonB-dependent receptor, partial [Polymorphobacter sp.]